jgi:hypothetical protein
MGFNFVGGSGLKESIDKLQNALTFNYYANTEIWDDRADVTSNEEFLKSLDKEFLAMAPPPSPPTLNQAEVENGQNNNSAIGTVTTSAPGEDAEVEVTGTSPDQTINFVLPRGEVGPEGPAGLPDQEDNAGKYLTTDGTDPFWETVDALPDQTGNEGKYLTTDGTDPEWAFLSGGSAADEAPTTGLVDGSIWLDTDGDILAPNGRIVRWVKTATAGQTDFSGASDGSGIILSYKASSEQVFLNGVQLVRGSDYTGSDGLEIVLVDPASVGDVLQVITLPFIENNMETVLTEERFEAKGDILTATDTNQPIPLAIGLNGQVLIVNTVTATGLEWSSVVQDNFTLNLMGAI